MGDSAVPITAGTGTNIDTRTESTNGQHRQVVVLGDPLLNNNVAAIASQDLSSSDQTTPGVVVRSAGSLSVQIVGSTGTIGTYIDSTKGTLNVQFSNEPTVVSAGKQGTTTRSLLVNTDGAIKVYDIANGSLTINSGTLTGITNSINVYVGSTAGTLLVADKSEPTVIASGKQGTTTRSFIANTEGAIKIYDIANGSITINSGTITGITNSINIYIGATAGTLLVADKSEPTVVAAGKQGTTTRSFVANTEGALKVYDIVTGTINTVAAVTNITNSINVYVGSTAGTIAVKLENANVGVQKDASAFTQGTSTGSPAEFIVDDTATSTVSEDNVGVPRMTANRIALAHLDSTASLFTASGSASGVSVSGNTLISPSANASFKVYAFSIFTTGQVSLTCKFTNGAGTGPTEFWRPLVTASAVTGVQGANLATMPSAPLFVTGTSTTLSLVLDSATLVHYSIAYTKESA